MSSPAEFLHYGQKHSKHSRSQCDKARKHWVIRRHAGRHSCFGPWPLHRSASAEKGFIHQKTRRKSRASSPLVVHRRSRRRSVTARRTSLFKKGTFSDRQVLVIAEICHVAEVQASKCFWWPRIRSGSERSPRSSLSNGYFYHTYTLIGSHCVL